MDKKELTYMEVLNDFRRGFLIQSLLTNKIYKFHKDKKLILIQEGLCFYPQYNGISKEELKGSWIKLNKVW